MSHKAIQTTLASAVADNGTFAIGYPSGTSAGNFTNGVNHYLLAMGGKFNDFDSNGISLSFGASSITVTYKGSTTIPAGTVVTLHLDQAGDADEEFSASQLNKYSGVAVARGTILEVNLGSPVALNSSGLVALAATPASGTRTLIATSLDVARNVIAKSSGNDSALVATVTGEDIFGDTVVENITCSNASTASGKKAFKSITSIITDVAAAGNLEFGWGDVLGLPVFIPDRAVVIEELKDGAPIAPLAVSKVYLPFSLNDTTAKLNQGYELASPVAGAVTKLVTTVSTTAIVTGGTVTVNVAGTAITGLSVSVANGTTVGTVQSDTPTDATSGNALVSVGSRISVVPASFNTQTNGAGHVTGYVEITPSAITDGTLVVGLDPQTPSTATTADVRGTYDPTTACDGTTGFSLRILCLDPEFKGTQYDG